MAEISQSWYTKYRPSTIADYMGDDIKEQVQKRFSKRENMPHVLMLQGDRGCGKTTLARMLTKHYLCQNLTEDGPCEQCEMCTQINDILISGLTADVECPGVQELDATIMRGVNEIEGVMEEARELPMYTDHKVIIIDECHMISSAGQNALLKTIEDIPPHLIVIFATTDPEKVLQTIKSRVQMTLKIHKQSVKDLANRLNYIAEQEGLTVSRQALEAIARAGNRVPRECIQLLESIAKTYNNEVKLEYVKEIAGDTSVEKYLEFLSAANTSLSEVLTYIKKLPPLTGDVATTYANGLNSFIMGCLYIKHGIALEEYPAEYIKKVKKAFEFYTSSDFDMLLSVIENMVHNFSRENQANNEALLTLSAMRISKIGMLAKGLYAEADIAQEENHQSLVEHSQSLKTDNTKALEILNKELDIHDILDTFDDIKEVSGTEGILERVNATYDVPEVVKKETPQKVETTEPVDENLGSAIDTFFD